MQITDEAFLTQLSYGTTQALLSKLGRIKENTPSFPQIAKHILALNSHLKQYDSFVALSNSKDFVKIKNQADKELLSDVNNIIKDWSDKYKITIEKVPNKETFYIKGYKQNSPQA